MKWTPHGYARVQRWKRQPRTLFRFDIYAHLADEIVRRGAAEHGLVWHYCRPPVNVLDYEIDCRGVDVERVIP